MAKITPIDIIKGVSGKFGGGNSKEYFATNKPRKRLNSCIILGSSDISSDTTVMQCV